MSRRSIRLATSGYYQEDDDGSSSSGGSVAGSLVSYKESPVRIFKKKSATGRSGSQSRGSARTGLKRSASNSSLSSQHSLTSSHVSNTSALGAQRGRGDHYWPEPETQEREFPVFGGGGECGTSDLRKANGCRLPDSLPASSTPQPTDVYMSSTSGYSSEDEQMGSTFAVLNPSLTAKLWDQLPSISPEKCLSMMYWWLGTAWYQLTTAVSLLDVYTLSRCIPSVKRVLLLLLFLMLGLLGLWLLLTFTWTARERDTPSRWEKQSKTMDSFQQSELLVKVRSLEQRLAQLVSASELKKQRQEEAERQGSEPVGKAGTGPSSLTREETTQLLEELIAQHYTSLQDELEQHSATRIQSELSVLRQEQDGQLERLLLNMNTQAEEIQREMKAAQSGYQSSVSDQRSLVARVSELGEVLGQLKSQLRAVRASQQTLASDVETCNSRIQSVRDNMETQVADLVHTLLFGASKDSVATASGQALTSLFVQREDLESVLRDLEKKILSDVAELHRQNAQQSSISVGAALAGAGITGVSEQEVKSIVDRALKLYSADKVGMVDYALESSGASVVSTRCSETFETKTALLSLFGIPLWYYSQSPRAVIQPDVNPGNCWAFKGSQGFVVIYLSARIRPTALTLEHIPKSVALLGSISSAPRDFAVYGLADESKEEGVLIGRYTYDQDSDPIQIFQVQNEERGAYQVIELRVHNNWGHPEYTCLYRFRVHGDPEK